MGTKQPRIVRFGANPPAPEHARPANVVAGDPVTTARNEYMDPSGRFFAGVWESTQGRWRVDYATEEEFCLLVTGRAVLTAEDGTEEHFAAGDAFVVPAGFKGTWETVEPVRKYYVIYDKAAPG